MSPNDTYPYGIQLLRPFRITKIYDQTKFGIVQLENHLPKRSQGSSPRVLSFSSCLLNLLSLSGEVSFNKEKAPSQIFLKESYLEFNVWEAVVRKCSVEKLFMETSQNSQENAYARVSFLIIVQALGLACNFIKKETLAQVFSCEFCEISKNTFFNRTPPVPLLSSTVELM